MGDLAFIFPGQGSQSVGMGRAFYDEWEPARHFMEAAENACGVPVTRLCFEGPAQELAKTEVAQPAIFTVSCVALSFAREAGLTPCVVAGHSLGEYSALVAAGVCDFESALAVVCERGRLMAAASSEEDGMAAVLGLDAEAVESALSTGADVEIANMNCPGQVVVSGRKSAIADVTERLKAAGAKGVVPLAVSGAFHTTWMGMANDDLAPLIGELVRGDPEVPIVQNATGGVSRSADEVLAALGEQMISPVLWEKSVATMAAMGVDVYVELGPGAVLKGLVRRCQPGATVVGCGEPGALDQLRERMPSA